MSVLIITSSSGSAPTGNRCSARDWAGHIEALGHDVTVADSYEGQSARVLIALNAAKTHDAVLAWDGPIIVVLTGTDVYPEPGEATLDSMRRADRVVGLQPLVKSRIPEEFHEKLRIIVQAAEVPESAPRSDAFFDICVVGHLRDVKDPMRAAAAARLLPEGSRIRIRHAGAILEDGYAEQIEREQAENPRYTWLGPLTPDEARRLIAESHLQVVSSVHEGGARVIGESVVAGTPVLAARNDASLSLLGADYPGLFDAGDTRALAELMARAESDEAFLESLRAAGGAERFDVAREREAWQALIREVTA